jgi:ppGpp synthetase/RelA/SpoT-type nucleotidyltranferase
MKTPRTVEDRLREEYFSLHSDAERVAEQLETEIRHRLSPFLLKLKKYEQIAIKRRVKDCESAINSLRRRQESRAFNQSRAGKYTLTALKDLAGIRVLVFPRTMIPAIDTTLRKHFSRWQADPVPGLYKGDPPLARKYCGYCNASKTIRAEFQIVPMLTGLFWDIEHAAIYKPAPQLQDAVKHPDIQIRTQAIYKAFQDFELELVEKIMSFRASGRRQARRIRPQTLR